MIDLLINFFLFLDDDEGIETTEDDLDLDSAKEVVSLCRHHLAVEREADEHYRGVCR